MLMQGYSKEGLWGSCRARLWPHIVPMNLVEWDNGIFSCILIFTPDKRSSYWNKLQGTVSFSSRTHKMGTVENTFSTCTIIQKLWNYSEGYRKWFVRFNENGIWTFQIAFVLSWHLSKTFGIFSCFKARENGQDDIKRQLISWPSVNLYLWCHTSWHHWTSMS